MKQIGLLFTPKNRALVRLGLKTQTRRGNKRLDGLRPGAELHHVDAVGQFVFTDGSVLRCPYGNPQVEPVQYYLKEPVQIIHPGDNGKMLVKWLDDGTSAWVDVTAEDIIKIDDRKRGWEAPTTALFMLQSFARTWLPGVRTWPERLGDLSAADAISEGVPALLGAEVEEGLLFFDGRPIPDWADGLDNGDPVTEGYEMLWESINGEGSWNPKKWVWGAEWQAPEVAA